MKKQSGAFAVSKPQQEDMARSRDMALRRLKSKTAKGAPIRRKKGAKWYPTDAKTYD